MTYGKNNLNCCNHGHWCYCCCWKWCPKPPTPPANSCAPTANLLENGDFEEPDINNDNFGWTFNNAARITPSPSTDRFSGSYIASLGTDDNNDNASISQTVKNIPATCPLQLSFAAQSPQSLTSKVEVTFKDDENTVVGPVFEREFTASRNDYNTFVYALETPANATQVTVTFLKEGSAKLNIDLVVLKV